MKCHAKRSLIRHGSLSRHTTSAPHHPRGTPVGRVKIASHQLANCLPNGIHCWLAKRRPVFHSTHFGLFDSWEGPYWKVVLGNPKSKLIIGLAVSLVFPLLPRVSRAFVFPLLPGIPLAVVLPLLPTVPRVPGPPPRRTFLVLFATAACTLKQSGQYFALGEGV